MKTHIKGLSDLPNLDINKSSCSANVLEINILNHEPQARLLDVVVLHS